MTGILPHLALIRFKSHPSIAHSGLGEWCRNWLQYWDTEVSLEAGYVGPTLHPTGPIFSSPDSPQLSGMILTVEERCQRAKPALPIYPGKHGESPQENLHLYPRQRFFKRMQYSVIKYSSNRRMDFHMSAFLGSFYSDHSFLNSCLITSSVWQWMKRLCKYKGCVLSIWKATNIISWGFCFLSLLLKFFQSIWSGRNFFNFMYVLLLSIFIAVNKVQS